MSTVPSECDILAAITYEEIQALLVERERLSSENAALRDQVEQLTGQVIGQGRIGVRAASLVSYLRTPLAALPFRAIQSSLATLHTLRLSVGGVRGIDPCRAAAVVFVGGPTRGRAADQHGEPWR